jgi:hypothetical protein
MDPTPATKEGGKHLVFWSLKFYKIEILFIFEQVKKNICANSLRILVLFTKKIVTKLSKIWDPRSGIWKKNLFGITNPGVEKALDPGSATLPARNPTILVWLCVCNV